MDCAKEVNFVFAIRPFLFEPEQTEHVFKGLVHPRMKASLCFTHPRGILGVYDFLRSDESN